MATRGKVLSHLSTQRSLDAKRAPATGTMQEYDDDNDNDDIAGAGGGVFPVKTTSPTTPSHQKVASSYAGTKNAAIRQRMKEQQGSGKVWKNQSNKIFASSTSASATANTAGNIMDGEIEEKKEADDYRRLAITVTYDENDDHDHDAAVLDLEDDAYTVDADADADADHYFTETTPAPSPDDQNNSYWALMGRYCDDKELEAFHAYEQGTLDLLQTSMMSCVSPDNHDMLSPPKPFTQKTPRPSSKKSTPHHALDLLQTSMMSCVSPDNNDMPSPPKPFTQKTPSKLDSKSTPHHVLDAWQDQTRRSEPTGFYSPPMPLQLPLQQLVENTSDGDDDDDDDDSHQGSSAALLSRLNTEQLEPSASTTTPTTTPFSTFRQNSTHIALAESKTYLSKITELEHALAASEENNRKSEKRVHELQDELSAVHRTPTSSKFGTPLTAHTPASPLSIPERDSLWERNKTLVKEVRFADQTCVELSGQKSVMEKEVTLLKEQRDQVRGELESLRDDLNESRQATTQAEARCESLQVRCKELESIGEEKAVDAAWRRDERIKMEADKKKHKEELTDGRDRLEAVCRQLQEIKEVRSMTEIASKEKLLTMEGRLLEGEAANKTLNKGLEEAELKLQSTEAVNSTLRMELLEAQSKLMTSIAACGTVKMEFHETENKLLVAAAAYDTLKMELQRAESKLEASGASNGTLQMELQETERKVQMAHQTVTETLKMELQEAQRKLQASGALSESLRMDMQETERKMQTTLTLNETFQLELQETKSKLQASGGSIESLETELEDTAWKMKTTWSVNETLQLELQEAASKLQASETVTSSLERQLQDDRLRVAQKVKSAFSAMQQRSDVWEERVATQTNVFASRLRQLSTTVSYITESFEFEEEYEHSFLTGDAEDDDIVPELDRSKSEKASEKPEETTLNATFNVGCNRSTDLEQMEEARSLETEDLSPIKIPAAVAEREDHVVPSSIGTYSDTMSSIAGISHLFSDGGNVSSLSAVGAMAQQSPGTKYSAPLFRPDESLQESQIQIQELLAHTAEIENDRDTLRQKVGRLEERLAKLDSELLSSTSTMEQVSLDRNSLQESLKALELKEANAQAELETTTSALEAAHALHRKYESSSSIDLKRVSDERDFLRDQLVPLQLEMAEAEAELETKASSVQAETQVLYRKIEDSSSALEEVSNERDSLLEQLASLQLEKAAVEAEVEATASSVQTETTELYRKFQDSSSTLEQVSNERGSFLEQLESLQHEKVEAEAELKATASSVQTETKELYRKIQDSSSTLEQVSNERDSLIEQLASLQLEKSELQTELKGKTAALDVAKELCDKLDMLSSSYSLQQVSTERDFLTKLETLQLEKAKLETELETIASTLAKTNDQCERLESESSATGEISSKNDLLEERLQTLQLEKKVLEAELAVKNSALSDTDERLASLSAILEQVTNEREGYRIDVGSLQHEKAELETELESKISALDDAYEQCAQFKSSSEQQSLSIKDHETEIARLEQSLHSSEDALDQLKIAYVECNDKLANHESANADTQALVEEYQKTLRAAEDLASDAESRWLETQNQLETIRIERDMLKEDHGITSERLTHFTEEMNELKSSMKVQLREEENALEAAVVEKERVLTASKEYKAQIDLLQGELRKQGDVGEILAEREFETQSVTAILRETNEKLLMVQQQLLNTNDALVRKGSQVTEAIARKDNVESKCTRLRDYIRKLTAKCDQWEATYEEQSRIVEGLRDAIIRTRQKAKDIALRYHQRDQIYTDERAQWSVERLNLTNVHGQLEDELDDIARELSNIGLSPGSM